MPSYDHHATFSDKQAKLAAITGHIFQDYDHFARSIPVSKQISRFTAKAASDDSNEYFPVLIGATSGTTGKIKPVHILLKNGGRSISSSERRFIYRLRERHVFSPQEVVGNLFTINLFSSLHQSANDIVSYCQGNIIPVGDISLLTREHFLFLRDAGLNVLFGVPATIMQFVEAMLAAEVKINVEKIVFTGESLRPGYSAWLRTQLGLDIPIIGLYGISECGFLGLSARHHGEYDLFSDDFFYENDPVQGLLVTTLDASAPGRLLRYPTGDEVELKYQDSQLSMRLLGRKDLTFKFIGNLISFESIATIVSGIIPDSSVQLVIRSEGQHREQLEINVAAENILPRQLQEIAQQLRSRPELAEAYHKQRGRLEVVAVAQQDFILSARGKHQFIIDERK